MALLLLLCNIPSIMALVMNDRRHANRVPLPLIVIFVLTLLAFLPLAIPHTGTSLQPVQGYSTPGLHPSDDKAQAAPANQP